MSTDDENVAQALGGMQGATGGDAATHQAAGVAAVSEGDFDDVRGGAGTAGVVADEALDAMQGGVSEAGISRSRRLRSTDGDNE